MNIGPLIDSAITVRSDKEGNKHVYAKADLCDMVKCPVLSVVLTDSATGKEIVLGAGYDTAPEVGWPMVMPRCTFESYRVLRGVTPEFIFDVGVYRDLSLVGVIEITSQSPLAKPKASEITKRGMWVAEITVSALREARRVSRIGGIIQILCARVVTP